ncbi:MAG TPA: tryptophan synthase subunit alpha [Chloroflexota bacterium]|nr:tryptophan synthase subunit alpha [Chloroflexota bacterium]
MNKIEHGRSHITTAFQNAQTTQTAALMPYFTLGYPDRETSLAIVEAIAPYSDLLELGVPFSDPLADGPTIQRSTQIALENGTTTAGCLDMVRELRQRGVHIPIMLMGYYNPILAYGLGRYVQDAAAVGVDGFIVPDLPPEEAEELEQAATAVGLCLIHFLAPTSSPERVAVVAARAQGFIYLVSLTGVTGARQQVQANLGDFVNRVRQQTQTSLAVGFGIGTPEQAQAVGKLADGVIVGSKLINVANEAEDKPTAVATFVHSLQQALKL